VRLETILKSRKIAYQALDVATNDQARMLWGRRAGKRKLPGLVRMGLVIGVGLSQSLAQDHLFPLFSCVDSFTSDTFPPEG
jgi:hypothetical protein